jgi:predicted phage tail protein
MPHVHAACAAGVRVISVLSATGCAVLFCAVQDALPPKPKEKDMEKAQV